jgi:hypothetical protein
LAGGRTGATRLAFATGLTAAALAAAGTLGRLVGSSVKGSVDPTARRKGVPGWPVAAVTAASSVAILASPLANRSLADAPGAKRGCLARGGDHGVVETELRLEHLELATSHQAAPAWLSKATVRWSGLLQHQRSSAA